MTGSASSFLSYIAEKKSSRYPERFGTGMIEGVVGPETANNAHANGALIPLFTLGIPASPTVAVIMGAFMMPVSSPARSSSRTTLTWSGGLSPAFMSATSCCSSSIAAHRHLDQILKIPYGILFGIILVFMVVGAYSVSNSVFDVVVMTLFGIIGYLLRKLDFPGAHRPDAHPGAADGAIAPPVPGDVQGSLRIFLESPIALVLLIVTALILIAPAFAFFRRGKGIIGGDEEGT